LSSKSASIVRLGTSTQSLRFWKGQLDEISIWDRPLTTAEITAVYAAGAGVGTEPLPRELPDAGATYASLDWTSPNFQLLSDLSASNFSQYGSYTMASKAIPTSDKGATLELTSSGWIKVPLAYDLTSHSVLAFDFKSTAACDVQGIGLDTDNTPDTAHPLWQVYGTTAPTNTTYWTYDSINGGAWQHYEIPVGTLYSLPMTSAYLFLANEIASGSCQSQFRNVRFYESP
jgi:hypothetical protein